MLKYQSVNHSFIQSSSDNSFFRKTVPIVPIVQLSKLSEHQLLMNPPPSRPPRASFSNSALKGLPKILTLTSSRIPPTKCVRAGYFGWEPHSPIRANSSSPGSRACRVGTRCRAVSVGLPFGFTDLRFSEGRPRSPFSAMTSYLDVNKIWRKVYPFG